MSGILTTTQFAALVGIQAYKLLRIWTCGMVDIYLSDHEAIWIAITNP